LLEVLSNNHHHGLPLKFFEASHVYFPDRFGELPKEKMRLGLVISNGKDAQDLFNQVKGDIENTLEEVGIRNIAWQRPKNTSEVYKEGGVADLIIGSQILGQLGLISLPILSFFELSSPVVAAELDLATITSLATDLASYQPPPKYPAVVEDLSLLVPMEFEVGRILEVLRDIKVEGVGLSAKIKEVYTGEGVEEGKKSVMLELTYQPLKDNLDAEAAASIREFIITALERNSPIFIRRA